MILISAGHHQRAQGAEFNGVTEYSLTTKWANRIADLLGVPGNRVPNGTLKEKIRFINDTIIQPKQTLAVEIHFNSAQIWKDLNANGVIDDNEMVHVGRGSETLYYPGSKIGLQVAETMQNALGQLLPPNRGAKEGWYQMNRAKGPDYFLARTKCTSIIIEPEFIDNLDVIENNFEDACILIALTLQKIANETFASR